MTAAATPPELPTKVVVPVLLATAAVLHVAGPTGDLTAFTELSAWSSSAGGRPAAAAFGCVRAVALVACYHLLAVQILTCVGRLLRRPGLEALADRFTPPPLRSTTRRLAGIGLAAAITTAPGQAAAAEAPASGEAVLRVVEPPQGTAVLSVVGHGSELQAGAADAPDRQPSGIATLAVVPGRVDDAAVAVPEDEGAEEGSPTAAPPSVRRHLVVPGDHLWSIAEAELQRSHTHHPDEAAVSAYWRQLVLANPGLDDPDLLFPGDVIELPPVRHTG